MDRLRKRQQRRHVRQWRRLLWGRVLQSVVLRFRLLPSGRNRYSTAEQPRGIGAETRTPDRKTAAIFDLQAEADALNPFITPTPASEAAITSQSRLPQRRSTRAKLGTIRLPSKATTGQAGERPQA